MERVLYPTAVTHRVCSGLQTRRVNGNAEIGMKREVKKKTVAVKLRSSFELARKVRPLAPSWRLGLFALEGEARNAEEEQHRARRLRDIAAAAELRPIAGEGDGKFCLGRLLS